MTEEQKDTAFRFEFEIAKNDGHLEDRVNEHYNQLLSLIECGNKAAYEKELKELIRNYEELTLKYNLAKYYATL